MVVDGPWSLSSPRADGFVVFFETLFSLSHRQYPRVVSAIHQATLFAAAHYPISIGHRHCGRVKPRDILPPADLVHRRRRLDKIDRIDGPDTVVTKSWMASTQAIWHPSCLASRASPAGRRDADATLDPLIQTLAGPRVITDRTLDCCCCHAALPSCVRPSSEAPLAQDNHPPGRRADRWASVADVGIQSWRPGGDETRRRLKVRDKPLAAQPDTEVFQWGRGVALYPAATSKAEGGGGR